MKGTIYSHNSIIGTADLHVNNVGINYLIGQFIPNENYFRNIQKKVCQLCITGKPNYLKWASFRFNVRLDNGCFLFASGRYTISDLLEAPIEPKWIHIEEVSPSSLNLRQNDLPSSWVFLEIDQKISFEDDLCKASITSKPIFNFLSSRNDHILLNAQVSAFAKSQDNDEVLFEVIKSGEVRRFAVVSLESSDKHGECPKSSQTITLFSDFNNFVESRIAAHS